MRNQVFTEAPQLDVLYQDDDLVAINKPSGLLVHRSEIDKRETLFAVQLTRDQIGQRVFPVHRLDRPTSGVLLFALNSQVARTLSDYFINSEIQKTYQALVRGYGPEYLDLDYPLTRELDKFADKDANKDLGPQEAQTIMKCLRTYEMPFSCGRFDTTRYSLMELQPKTGRKHQIRRHLAHIRHPIIGDTKHGDGKQNKLAREQLGLNRLALHATKLEFVHPTNKKPMVITAPIDETLANPLALLNNSNIHTTLTNP